MIYKKHKNHHNVKNIYVMKYFERSIATSEQEKMNGDEIIGVNPFCKR